MNSRIPFSFSRLGIASGLLLALGPLGTLHAAESINTWVSAERAYQGREIAAPTLHAPRSYVLIDGGYLEHGDPVANTRAPRPEQVELALHRGLDLAHYAPAAEGTAPDVAIVYHWGVLRHGTVDQRLHRGVSSNLRARVRLLADAQRVKSIESLLENGGWRNPRERDLLIYANDNRHFLVVSAYDARAATGWQARLLWRVKLSAPETESSMIEAIPAFAAAIGEFTDRTSNDDSLRLHPIDRELGAAAVGQDRAASFPEAIRQALAQREHEHLLGRTPTSAYLDGWTGSEVKPALTPALPDALNAQIAAYFQEKARLHQALRERLSRATPSTRRGIIDTFNREHADAIAALGAEHDAIREALSRQTAKRRKGEDQATLDALQQEFSAARRSLAAAPSGDDTW
jgi:hypothetical protein